MLSGIAYSFFFTFWAQILKSTLTFILLLIKYLLKTAVDVINCWPCARVILLLPIPYSFYSFLIFTHMSLPLNISSSFIQFFHHTPIYYIILLLKIKSELVTTISYHFCTASHHSLSKLLPTNIYIILTSHLPSVTSIPVHHLSYSSSIYIW